LQNGGSECLLSSVSAWTINTQHQFVNVECNRRSSNERLCVWLV